MSMAGAAARGSILTLVLALVWVSAGCGGREADAPRPPQAQVTGTSPAATPGPSTETQAPATDNGAAQSAPQAAPAPPADVPPQTEVKPATVEDQAQAPLPALPSPDQRVAAPELKLRDMAGREITLSSLRGKAVMVVFWATWCRPCVMEVPELVRLHGVYKDRGLRILAISLDQNGMAAVKPFLDKHPEITYTIVPSGYEAQAAFGGIRSIPNSFVVDKQGRVVKQFVGLTPGQEMEGWVRAVLREKG